MLMIGQLLSEATRTPSRYMLSMISRIQFGDARSQEAHGNDPVHLVVTSPPYWTIKDYNTTGQIGHGDGYEDYIAGLDEVWSRCYARLLPGCKMCINVGDQFLRAKTTAGIACSPFESASSPASWASAQTTWAPSSGRR